MIKIRNASPKAYKLLKEAGVVENSLDNGDGTYNLWLRRRCYIMTGKDCVLIFNGMCERLETLDSADFLEVIYS